jgi:C-terminal processing protease CtpA/Prc
MNRLTTLRGFNVRNTPIVLTTAVLLATGAAAMASAADSRSTGTDAGSTNSTNPTKADLDATKAGQDAPKADLDARLAEARARLEEAAHEVAELSAQVSKPVVDNFMLFTTDGPPRAVIGVQLDTNSGKDGARIQEVSPGGPAAEAGLRVGDLIVAVNGADVKGDNPAREVLHQMRKVDPDSKVKVTVMRDGKPHEFAVTARPGAGHFGMHELHHPHPPLPPNPAGDPFFEEFSYMPPMMIHGPLGEMELATLSPQLGRYFGTDKGVLVVRAPKEEGFKLEDGDVILAIDGREPTSGSHATRILGSYQPGEKISIKLMRQHKAMNIETTLPERRLTGPGPESDRKVRVSHREAGSTT